MAKKQKIDATRSQLLEEEEDKVVTSSEEDDEEEEDSSSEEGEEGDSEDSSEEENDEEEDKVDKMATEKKPAVNSILKIKAVGENAERKISPIVGYFSSGYDPLPGNSRTRVYKSVKSRNPANPRLEVVVGTNNPQVNFVGTSYSGEATAPQLCNYALGVLDKETGVLKMVPIAANRIFRMIPKVPEVGAENEGNEEVVIEPRTLDTFSAKKDISRDKKKVNLRISETSVDQKDINMEGTTNADALASTTGASFFHAQNLPPHNLDATTPDMAYPLDKIISKGEWDCLRDIYELVQSGSHLDSAVYPSFVRNRISKLAELKDESERKRMAGILSYMTHLIKFRDKHSMDHFRSAKSHKFPSRLIQKFNNMFEATHGQRIPPPKLILLINYIVVLSLIVDDFSSDPTDIAKDLHMNSTDIRTHYGYLGCKMKGSCSTLPLPLTMQTVLRGRKKRK